MQGARTAAHLATAGEYTAQAFRAAGATDTETEVVFPVFASVLPRQWEEFGGRPGAAWKDLFLTAIVMQSRETLKVCPLGKVGLFIPFNNMVY